MWITIKNVAHKIFSWAGIGFLASAVGDHKRLNPDTELCKNFDEAKVFVDVDLSKDLPSSFCFKSEKGVDVVVEFKYSWLPPKCSVCVKCGHLAKSYLGKQSVASEASPAAVTQNNDTQTTGRAVCIEAVSPDLEVLNQGKLSLQRHQLTRKFLRLLLVIIQSFRLTIAL